ncbi:molybdenum ABC transporter ATP-binding protein [Pseudoruegeria sp. SHC-113]|uniref:molybdenum ABC transporter ATP-binding protein n=1 Tax=Pseudoruegeria sp. SHC-113 TaxID=2855439 RepID=UPI0021BAB36E|nr:molybdenum ABC transporter ATP-binding protein [Pseudoruegeria sp. SHC-113]MCT8159563.1 molybdenum ABC transporter ATP-binding protein [Pseudoruegeria sp. SHC-113]
MLKVDFQHTFPGLAFDIRFKAAAGITVLLGPSGCGKTTVVNAIAGILRPDVGRISLGQEVLMDSGSGRFLPPRARRIGYVFQDARLFPHMSVESNLLYGARRRGIARNADFQELVALLGLGGLLKRAPARLSGGERQRVALGRALLSGPDVLLMDEPMAALDEGRKADLLPYIERLAQERAVPMLYVTHNISEAARLADTIVVLERGRVAAFGPAADVFSDPELAPVLGVREAGAVVEGRVEGAYSDGLAEVAVPGGRLFLPGLSAEKGAAVRLRIEAQDVMIALEPPRGISALNILPVVVTSVKQGHGPGVLVQLANGDMRLLARVTKRSAMALDLREGLACHAVLKSVSVARDGIQTRR